MRQWHPAVLTKSSGRCSDNHNIVGRVYSLYFSKVVANLDPSTEYISW